MAASWYWTVFVGGFLAVAAWESVWPLRALHEPAGRRWGRHGLLFAASLALTALVFRLSPVTVAALAEGRNGAGLRTLPWGLSLVCTLLLLDLVHYGVHWSCHHVAALWRLHAVHHSDEDYDVSTAVRFHPVESLLSKGVFTAVVAALGPDPAAVLASELLTVAMNLFAHGNIRLPGQLDIAMRWLLVTPGVHRIHHSVNLLEQNRNFGQTFTVWDRLFGTYLERSGKGEGFATG